MAPPEMSRNFGDVPNIAPPHPENPKPLYEDLMNYLTRVGARSPEMNPNFDPQVYCRDRNTVGRLR